jgi:hypothetical protein
MRFWKLWLSLFVILALAAGGGWLYWDNFVRWKPQTITVNQLEITRMLEGSGWVSPHRNGPVLYMISFRDCPDCQRFEREVFPLLERANVDTRVIMVARPDAEGVARSTPAERATVAELWANRNWALWQRWHATTPQLWTAEGVPPADGDITRTAVIEAGRKMVEDISPLLGRNHIRFAYPLLVWTTRDGELHGCACESARTYRYVIRELGA